MGSARAVSVRRLARTLDGRTRTGDRAMERVLPSRYPKRLNELHEEWFKDYKMVVLVLPTNRLHYIEVVVDPADLLCKSERFL